MAKLLSTANWPETITSPPDYPVELHLNITPPPAGEDSARWVQCEVAMIFQPQADSAKDTRFSHTIQLLRRDIERLANELKDLTQQRGRSQLTFVPVAAGFEIWLQRLSDDQFRVIVWQDMADEFTGVSDVAHQGWRFMTNRARLLGFVRSLEADLSQ